MKLITENTLTLNFELHTNPILNRQLPIRHIRQLIIMCDDNERLVHRFTKVEEKLMQSFGRSRIQITTWLVSENYCRGIY